MAMHFNDNFIYINGRPVGHIEGVDIKELEDMGFTRITKDFNDNAFDVVQVAETKADNRKGGPKAPGKDGPVIV